ncbi:hypothetical protein LUZ61_020562 [Rhynchospora tenuis]|uniref:Protein kinase domain-containing protein n=1 Tax=Rhynchospora tenuis TaxID=198213 RepID=A0AAD6ENY5_9POAL|nr:hypothetical protein LUZ61_020562 [Rhynchospora tenuis]
MGLVKPSFSLLLCFFLLLAPHSLSQSAINDAQSLLLLKSAIDGSNSLPWRLDSASSLCTSWLGVKECSPEGRVTKLVLESLNLTGTLKPNILSSLDQLRVLSFKSNSLSGQIPDLSSLSNLKSLYLNQNKFSGNIPSSLSLLHRLKVVVLSDNLLTGSILVELTSVQRLYSLQLQNNRLTGKIPPFSQPSLRFFNVSFNNLSGKIPFTKALSQFNLFSFSSNPHLCGQQIDKICTRDSFFTPSPSPKGPEQPFPSATIDAFPPLVTSGHENNHKKRLIAIIAGSIAGGILLFALISILLFVVIFKKKKKKVAEVSTQPREHEPKTAERETEPATAERRDEPQRPPSKPAFSWETESSGKLVFCGGVGDMYGMEELLRASAETLGRGSVGSTYKAVMETGFIVTVKRLREVAVKEEAARDSEEFRRKAEELGQVRHPNIVPLRAYFQAKEERLLVYDYFPNGSLFSLIHGSRPSGKGKPLHWTSCLKIAEDVAAGLLHLHQSGLVHANLKPSNVLLGADFESCLTDFSLVPTFLPPSPSPSSSLPSPSSSSLFYQAPETRNLRSLNAFTPSSDIYSFGILLLELLTGKVPFQGLVEEHGKDIPKWVRSVREEEKTESGEESDTAEEKLGVLLEIAITCVAVDAGTRPRTEDVLRMVRDARAEAMVASSNNSSDRERDRPGNSPGQWSDTVQSLSRDRGSESFTERD